MKVTKSDENILEFDNGLVIEMSKPNPGSKEAIAQSCTCAVMDNHYGKGFGKPPMFWISDDCPLHAPKKEQQ